ncbi:MAG: shikimate kinase [Paludibacter sp.]|nr:shikimate kinase [Paludibacter sp.]
MKPIFLIGFSGAGKTTVGKIISAQMNLQFIDLDDFIENQQGKTIVQIFSQPNGESLFRSMETKYLREFSARENIIVATGGGTACLPENLELIESCSISFYLKWNECDLLNRLKIDGMEKRPLLAGKTDSELADFIHILLEKRKLFYQKAHFTVSAKNDFQLAQKIIEIIKKV